MLFCGYLVKEMQQHAAHEVAEAVVREDVEERDYLVDVLLDRSPNLAFIELIVVGVDAHGLGDLFVGEEGLPNSSLRGKLETIEVRPSQSQGTKCAAVDTSLQEFESHERPSQMIQHMQAFRPLVYISIVVGSGLSF